jgi:hypothetical protein
MPVQEPPRAKENTLRSEEERAPHRELLLLSFRLAAASRLAAGNSKSLLCFNFLHYI